MQAALNLLSPRLAKQALLAAVLADAAAAAHRSVGGGVRAAPRRRQRPDAAPQGGEQLGSGPSLTPAPPEVPGIFAVF